MIAIIDGTKERNAVQKFLQPEKIPEAESEANCGSVKNI
jgi:hypothetical protein